MKVDIQIYFEEGSEYFASDLTWDEACATIINEHISEMIEDVMTSNWVKDFIYDEATAILKKEKENENNEN